MHVHMGRLGNPRGTCGPKLTRVAVHRGVLRDRRWLVALTSAVALALVFVLVLLLGLVLLLVLLFLGPRMRGNVLGFTVERILLALRMG